MQEQSTESAPENRPEKIERDTNYWLSLEHYAQDPEFLKLGSQEFASSPLKEGEENAIERRDFLKLMGASIALASTGCLRRPVQKVVPYNKQPEEVTLGVPNYYTSSYSDGVESLGLLIKTREGRPIKVEGNPEHPNNKGAVSISAQASILNLYDPDRLNGPRKNLWNEKRTNKDTVTPKWDAMDDEISAQLKKGSVVILSSSISSPSLRSIVSEFSQGFAAKHLVWDAHSNDQLIRARKMCFGAETLPVYQIDKAKLILSIDADFLATFLTPMAFSKQFSKGRREIEKMSRLVSFDSTFSLTGANADLRYRIKPSQQLDVVMAIFSELEKQHKVVVPAALKNTLDEYRNRISQLNMDGKIFAEIAKDLWENRGQSIVMAGGIATQTEFSEGLFCAVNCLNSILGNEGKTILERPAVASSSFADIKALITSMTAGKVKTLILHKVNPIYHLPESFGFAEALKKVDMVVSTADRIDETSQYANYIIPDNHPLEAWGDSESLEGVISLQQPSIRPLYDSRAFALSLMNWGFIAKMGPKRLLAYETYYDYLRNYWKEDVLPKVAKGQNFDDFWAQALQKGFVGSSRATAGKNSAKLEMLSHYKASESVGPELVLYPTVMMGDGSQTNISWLHELPDPVTKITWDNYASVSIAFAKKNSLSEGDVIELDVNGKKLELPTHIQPGLHDEVIAVAVGYGRTKVGRVANNVGRNSYSLVSDQGIFSGQKVTIKKTSRKEKLANPQGNQSMEGRQIVVEATVAEYQKKKSANIHRHHTWSIWPGQEYNGNKWGMSVDLNSCTGCNACVVSCQSENNIPVVGKKYVLEGREMAWIRIDRYYTGTPDNPEVVFQPVMCQQCSNAPCETVCPVLATVHTDDGLNAMVYNRCVGTRYCSNNCPYKVRRFNWFAWNKKIEAPLNMALNPEVTVRIRGVMEKCTFCVQRIKTVKNTARLENRKIKDGEIKTACQVVCPTDAIVFGDMNDPNSAVSALFKDERAYALLEEWHAAPSVRYLSKIRNNGEEKRHSNSEEHV